MSKEIDMQESQATFNIKSYLSAVKLKDIDSVLKFFDPDAIANSPIVKAMPIKAFFEMFFADSESTAPQLKGIINNGKTENGEPIMGYWATFDFTTEKGSTVIEVVTLLIFNENNLISEANVIMDVSQMRALIPNLPQ